MTPTTGIQKSVRVRATYRIAPSITLGTNINARAYAMEFLSLPKRLMVWNKLFRNAHAELNGTLIAVSVSHAKTEANANHLKSSSIITPVSACASQDAAI